MNQIGNQNQEKPLNIYQKLVEVRKTVLYMKKGEQGHNFKYASGADIIGALRVKMDELGLLLVPNMESFELVPFKKGATEVQVMKVCMSYTWINADNPEERLSTSFTYFEDRITGCQGIGSLQTYAERYFLYKFFQVATDDDSPEQFYSKHKLSNKLDPKEYEPKKEKPAEPLVPTLSDEMIHEYAMKWSNVSGGKMEYDLTSQWLAKCRLFYSQQSSPEKATNKAAAWDQDPELRLKDYKAFEKKAIEAGASLNKGNA